MVARHSHGAGEGRGGGGEGEDALGEDIETKKIKTESSRKLSNFNLQWTKTLYQDSLKHIAFFFLHFSGAIDIIS